MPRLVLVVFMVEFALLAQGFPGGDIGRIAVDGAGAEAEQEKNKREPHFRSLPLNTASARLSMNAV